MEHRDFKIGEYFYCGGRKWLCTDKGTRSVVAVRITPEIEADPSWLNGPPYAVAEQHFDEYDMDACGRDPKDDDDAPEHPLPEGPEVVRKGRDGEFESGSAMPYYAREEDGEPPLPPEDFYADHPDNEKLGWWIVRGTRHTAFVRTDHAGKAVRRADEAGLVKMSWEHPDPIFWREELPDAFGAG